jgi:antirestriction protein ArdC
MATDAKTAAREERLEALHEALVEQTKTLTTSEGWMQYLEFVSKFRQYSLNNTLLILCQRPDSTHVASYKRWTELGRQVRKGERSMSIFAPMMRKREDEKTGEEKRYISGFRAVPVFDVKQTDGDPVPEPVLPALLDGEAPEGLWDALLMIVDASGYHVERGDCHGANGFTRPSEKLIKVREDVSNAQATKTLAHEIAHMILHCGEEGGHTADAMLHRSVAEVEAESVAHIVANVHGLPTESYSLPYIAGWSDGKPEAVAATADRVLKCAKQILAITEPSDEEVAASV